MSRNKLVVIVGLVGLLPIAGETQAAQEQMGHWTLETDSRGGIVSMSYPNPRTAMDLVQVLEISVQANTTATQGHLTFKDGVKRDMTKEEVAFYYTSLDGPKATWDYLAAKDRVTKFAPATAALPANLAGSFIRVIFRDGGNFFGKLAFESAKPGGFILAVDGASGGPIRFENNVVREVQIAK